MLLRLNLQARLRALPVALQFCLIRNLRRRIRLRAQQGSVAPSFCRQFGLLVLSRSLEVLQSLLLEMDAPLMSQLFSARRCILAEFRVVHLLPLARRDMRVAIFDDFASDIGFCITTDGLWPSVERLLCPLPLEPVEALKLSAI